MSSNKLREALKVAKRTLCRWQADLPSSAWVEVETALRKIESALAEPLKNCEVGTVEDQAERFDAFVRDRRGDKKCTGKCPAHNGVDFGVVDCVIQWSQMPYESEVK